MTHFCPSCFADKSLSSQLTKARPQFDDGKFCDFHPSRKGIPGTYVAELVDGAIRSHYTWADPNPYVRDGNSLSHVLTDLVSPENEDILAALQGALEETELRDTRKGGAVFYDDTQNFIRFQSGFNPLHEMWERFKFDIVHRQRFFSDRATNWLNQIFSELEHQRDADRKAPIYTVNPGKTEWTLFRARRIDNSERRKEVLLNPAVLLGPPPERQRRAGRLNAAGVSCFYGAFDAATCLAEIRPPVGSWVVTAEFELRRPVTVLDTTRFSGDVENRSIFSPIRQKRLDQWRFMQMFQNEVKKPILPDDELLDYIPTQVVAEFIQSALPDRVPGLAERIDGIIYGSAQRPQGRNIALFGEAALIHGSQTSDEEAAMSKAEIAGLWDDGAGYQKPSMEGFLGPDAALIYRSGSVKEHCITGVDLTWTTKNASPA